MGFRAARPPLPDRTAASKRPRPRASTWWSGPGWPPVIRRSNHGPNRVSPGRPCAANPSPGRPSFVAGRRDRLDRRCRSADCLERPRPRASMCGRAPSLAARHPAPHALCRPHRFQCALGRGRPCAARSRCGRPLPPTQLRVAELFSVWSISRWIAEGVSSRPPVTRRLSKADISHASPVSSAAGHHSSRVLSFRSPPAAGRRPEASSAAAMLLVWPPAIRLHRLLPR